MQARKIGNGIRRIFASPRPTLGELDYDAYWSTRSVDEHQPRFAIIAGLVPPASRVLDVGSGDGSLLLHLAASRSAVGFGIDVSSVAVEHARQRGVRCEVADITDPSVELPPDIDVVIISEVLEHISDPEAVLQRIRAHMPRRVIITVPNTGYLEHRLRLLFGRFPVQWLLHPGEHVRFWTIADFRLTASVTGFALQRVIPALGWFPFARLRPSLFASQVIYVLEPISHVHSQDTDSGSSAIHEPSAIHEQT